MEFDKDDASEVAESRATPAPETRTGRNYRGQTAGVEVSNGKFVRRDWCKGEVSYLSFPDMCMGRSGEQDDVLLSLWNGTGCLTLDILQVTQEATVASGYPMRSTAGIKWQ